MVHGSLDLRRSGVEVPAPFELFKNELHVYFARGARRNAELVIYADQRKGGVYLTNGKQLSAAFEAAVRSCSAFPVPMLAGYRNIATVDSMSLLNFASAR